MANDPYWNSVVLAMHMDDTGLTDLKGNTITAVGNAARSSTQSKFGGYSLYLDGAGDYLTAQYNPAKFDWWTEYFTLEAWVYADAFTTWQYSDGTYLHAKMIGNTAVAAFITYWSFGPLASGVVQFRYLNGSATSAVVSTQTVTAGAWNHIAIVKTSAGINIFVNGVGLKMPVPINGTPLSAAGTPLAVGVMNSAYLAGYIDDMRITKGVARYTANFAVPTEAFPNRLPQLHGTVKDQYGNFAARPIIAFSRNRAGTVFSTTSDATTGEFTLPVNEASEHVAIALPVEGDQHWSNVVLAMHMDDTGLTDLKGNTITAVGNAARSSTQSKFGGYSLYLDGAGDYLTAQYNPAKFDWWTEYFTLEAWVYADAFTTWQYSDGTYLHAKMIGNTAVAAFITYWSFGPLASGVVQFRYLNGSATSAVVSTQTVTAGAWNHIAIVKTSAGINIFVNGVGLKMPVPINGTPLSAAGTPLAVGVMNSAYLAGYIDDLRITKGVARYIANFTPPSAAFPHAVTGGTENALIFDNLIPV